jgi:hypothetical protein
MITDRDLIYTYDSENLADALVWIIDGNCLYDIPVAKTYSQLFLSSDEVIDVSEEYPDHDGITVKFIKNGEEIEIFQTTEYFGNILLSDPLVLILLEWPFGRYVESPNAEFDGEKFIVTNRNISNLMPFAPVDQIIALGLDTSRIPEEFF